MGIFVIDIFLLDFPFTGRKRNSKVCLRFQLCDIYFSGVVDNEEIFSAVSLTLRKSFQRCKWHRWDFYKKFWRNFSLCHYSDLSGGLTLLKSCQRRLRPDFHSHFSDVVDADETISAVSLTPWKRFHRCNWHHWTSNIINFLGEYEALCELALAC
jgi:hypothetical protein